VGEFNPQTLANMGWAFATAGHAAPELFDAIAAEAAPRLGEFTPQNLTNTAWSFAVTNSQTSAVLVRLFGYDFGRRCDVLGDSFLLEDLTQLHQWWLWYARERGQTAGLPSRDVLQRCRVAFSATDGQPSNL
jgi:hypothetical protein